MKTRQIKIDPKMWFSPTVMHLSYRAKGLLADIIISGHNTVVRNPMNNDQVEAIRELFYNDILIEKTENRFDIKEEFSVYNKLDKMTTVDEGGYVKMAIDAWNALTTQKRISSSDVTVKVQGKIMRLGIENVIEAFKLLEQACLDVKFFYSHRWHFVKFITQENGIESWLPDGKMYCMYYNSLQAQKDPKASQINIREF